MIQKIYDWTAGSFFRTIGRLLVFVIIGFLVAKLVDFSHINWTDLLGIETVKADSLTNTIWQTYYVNSSKTTQLATTNSGNYQYEVVTNNGANINGYYVYLGTDIVKSNYDYILIPFLLTTEYYTSETSSEVATCNSYAQYGDMQFCTGWNIPQISVEEYSTKFSISLHEKNGDNDSPCTYENGFLKCSVLPNVTYGRLYLSYSNTSPSVRFNFGKAIQFYKDIFNSIESNQQTQIQQQNGTLSYFQDSNTTSTEEEASSFFEDFSVSDHGGLSSILTAPLTIVSKVLDDTCTPATFTYRNKQVVLPCGQYFWNQAPELRDWLSTIESGIIAYAILVALFKMIQRLESPSNSEVEVESL